MLNIKCRFDFLGQLAYVNSTCTEALYLADMVILSYLASVLT